jgi:DNA repair protein RecO (recombination protein O)
VAPGPEEFPSGSDERPDGGRAGSQATDALLLRSLDYRDSDRIVTLFTQAQGKLSALARGARSSKRRFAGSLEPYAVVRVECTPPRRGELWTLGSAVVERSFSGILQDLGRMEVAAAALLLLREALPARAADSAVFLASLQYLTLVDLAGDAERAGLLAFTLRVLSTLGLSPRLDACGRSGDVVPPGRPAYFDPRVGAVVSRRMGGGPFLLSGGLRERLMRAQGADWLAVAREPFPQEELQLARAALASFLSAHVPGDVGGRLFPA